jgi:hypothetical protein
MRLVVLALLLAAAPAAAQAPERLSYQAALTDPSGLPVPDGPYAVTFRLYAAPTGGSALWTETHPSAAVAGGVLTVELGSVASLGGVAFDAPRWLSIQVGADPEMAPRTALLAAPAALGLRNLRVVPQTAAEGPNLIGGWSGNTVGSGVEGATIDGGGDPDFGGTPKPNRVTGDYGVVGGGRGNTAVGFNSTIGGGLDNVVEDPHATIGGGQGNVVTNDFFAETHGTIGGGQGNLAGGNHATIAGGLNNTTDGEHAVIGGGVGNTAGNGYATVGGGQGNTATGNSSTIGGGEGNTTGNGPATIGGGTDNTASGSGTVGGGSDNQASGSGATVGGGTGNEAITEGATVGGGFVNRAVERFTTVAGGSTNTADAQGATVGGGDANVASGFEATVPGGDENHARGSTSFAAGRRARAAHAGTFVWADRSVTTGADSLVSTAPNQFLIRAAGGVGIGTNAPTNELTVGGDADLTGRLGLGTAAPTYRLSIRGPSDPFDGPVLTFSGVASDQPESGRIRFLEGNATSNWRGGYVRYDGDANRLHIGVHDASDQNAANDLDAITIERNSTHFVGIGRTNPSHPLHVGTGATNGNGAHVTAGGAWTNGSSRAFKEAFEPVDPAAILAGVAALPVQRWRYRGAEAEGVHLGPVAEEFAAAFGLGGDARYIATVDADGVALAAIQALERLAREQAAEIEALRGETDALRGEVARLRALDARVAALEAGGAGGR